MIGGWRGQHAAFEEVDGTDEEDEIQEVLMTTGRKIARARYLTHPLSLLLRFHATCVATRST